MPAKRRDPKQLRPKFSPEVLRVFSELEKLPPRKRFEDPRTKQLAGLLDLWDEFWTVQYVNNPHPPAWEPPYIAHKNWHTCRHVRLQLLEATGLAKKSPTAKAVADLRNGS